MSRFIVSTLALAAVVGLAPLAGARRRRRAVSIWAGAEQVRSLAMASVR